jgi:hypothetical protein
MLHNFVAHPLGIGILFELTLCHLFFYSPLSKFTICSGSLAHLPVRFSRHGFVAGV